MSAKQPFCLVVVDQDSGFLTVLRKRAEPKSWRLRNTSGGVPPEELVAMKPDALIAAPTALGDDALDYLKRVRERCPDLGMIVCTERSTLAQRVGGLRLGVDDWITKPCHPKEALARVEAVSRRRQLNQTSQDSAPLFFAELEIRPDLFQALVRGESLDLTRREFEVLHLIAEAKGQTLEREAIYQRVWGYAMAHGDPPSPDAIIAAARKANVPADAVVEVSAATPQFSERLRDWTDSIA